MEDQVDQLKAIDLDARTNMSTDYVELHGLEMVRAHQRGEPVGFRRTPTRARQPKKAFTDEQINDMSFSTESLNTVAKRNGTTKPTVAYYRSLQRRDR